MKFINIGFGNMVSSDKITCMVTPDSAPAKRLVQTARESGRLIDASQGRKTRGVLVMENGSVILSALNPDTIAGRLNGTGDSKEAKEQENDD
ncbi:MAG: DUF370 domain-containing protein [Lachnospiraceae bacterium]|jgi:regulator of extracellular matrix RemA (YlzA/DUF370 family)|nr:DUF370 domain-containing protein [Lachnospiraceae bacterium]MDD6666557.1 DUF370 domain-containing protein [Lachnospiraceae bacterium]